MNHFLKTKPSHSLHATQAPHKTSPKRNPIRSGMLAGAACAVLLTTQLGAPMMAQASPPAQTQGPAFYISQGVVDELSQAYNLNVPKTGSHQFEILQLVTVAAPNWRFARVLNHTTCLPALAYDSNFVRAEGASLKNWPIPGQSGCTQEEDRNEMVTYIDPRVCNADTIRIGYWLYFKKDGFSGGVENGHRHDWEGAVVEWKRIQGDQWSRNQVIVSYHKEYHSKRWDDSSLAKTEDALHPVIFSGWAHHAMHWNKGGRADLLTTLYDDLRNSYIKLNAWDNMTVIPWLPAQAQNVLQFGDYGKANPPLSKQICNL